MSRCVFVFVLLLAVCLFMCSCGVKTIVTSEYVSEYPTTEFEVNSDNMSKVISQNEVSSNSDAGSSSNKPTSSHNPSSNTATSTESEPNESENEFNYANYYTRATDDKAEAIIYKATEGYPTFDNYVVQVNVGSNWYNVPVYNAEVKRVNEPVQNTYFAHFDLSGEATVRIIPWDNFSSFEVNPQHDIQNLQKTLADNGVLFVD